MKIAYIDLGINNPPEDYSIYPCRYGGGSCFARYAKEELNKRGIHFRIYGPARVFDSLDEEDNDGACITVEDFKLDFIKQGVPAQLLIPELTNYDIVLHHHDCLYINTSQIKAKSVHWSLSGKADGGHPLNDCDLLYNHEEAPCFQGQKILPVQIGKYIPPYQKHDKKDFVFACSRHDTFMNTIEVAKNCLEYGIQGFFGGPIFHDYPLLNYIDGKTTHYLGVMHEEDKLLYTRTARLYPLLCDWDVVFNQSALEANGEGTPLLVTPRGWFNGYVKEGVNGFFYNGKNFLDCYKRANLVDPKACNMMASKYNVKNMIDSFLKAFTIILSWG